MSHFRIFGAFVYCHFSKESRKNLESIVELGVFVGYIEIPHNYRVYLSSLIMKFIQRDVKFDEEKAMNFSLEREPKIPPKAEFLT